MQPTSVALITLPGPEGPFVVATTERGVVAAEWRASETQFLGGLQRRLGAIDISPDGPAADQLRQARPLVEALLAGRPVDPAGIAIDLDDRPAFDQRVLEAVRTVGWGETASYGEIARRVGAPRAARAVGGAVARCPIAMLIPCHRIIAADGTLGGYGGDGPFDRTDALERKRLLLLREGVTVGPRAV